jgi:Arc/MetJ family transcription regulator
VSDPKRPNAALHGANAQPRSVAVNAALRAELIADGAIKLANPQALEALPAPPRSPSRASVAMDRWIMSGYAPSHAKSLSHSGRHASRRAVGDPRVAGLVAQLLAQRGWAGAAR